MAFNIGLMTCTAKNNVVDKTRYISNQVAISCILREGSSVMNPVIEIETPTHIVTIDGVDTEVDYDVTKFNYAHIPFFNNRYYYIEDIVSVNNRLWELHLKCDVLYSFAAEIYKSNAVVTRSSTGNAYISEYSETDRTTLAKTEDYSDVIELTYNPYNILTVSGGA